ncbi:MAG: hypothetical protein CHACPFDD_01334 [Phycisphaerae bacterium]|nr:hypothetical protein [Phycisphaerae bacterium]
MTFRHPISHALVWAAWIACCGPPARGQPSGASATSQPSSAPAAASKPAEKKPYVSKSWGSRLETQPPGYARPLSETGLPGTEAFDWMILGLEHRTRWEFRDDDPRRPILRDDNQFLMRSRGYFGIQKVLDPLRFGLEFQDARQFNSSFPESDRDVDENEIIQLHAELYFPDVLGKNEPLRFQFGRMSLEYVDRRLVGRNRWRNTTNAFDGFRVQLGEAASDWQVDFFAAQPVERRLRRFDPGDDERWFYGLVGAWRKWSQYVTIEPYWFVLDEDRVSVTAADREIHTLGVRAFGPIGKSGFDYDVNNAFQFGDDGVREQRAYAMYAELGYTFQHAWKPRLSLSATYGSGDRNPADRTTERFDRLFAVNHGWSTTDAFTWQNTISPKLRLELQPLKQLRLDGSYGGYLLASDNDAWVTPARRDATGLAGTCVGQELEVRLRYQIDEHMELETGYSYFIPGAFVENTGPADDSDFFYFGLTVKL